MTSKKDCAVDAVILGVNHENRSTQEVIDNLELESNGRINCRRFGECALHVDQHGNFVAESCISRGYPITVLVDQTLREADPTKA